VQCFLFVVFILFVSAIEIHDAEAGVEEKLMSVADLDGVLGFDDSFVQDIEENFVSELATPTLQNRVQSEPISAETLAELQQLDAIALAERTQSAKSTARVQSVKLSEFVLLQGSASTPVQTTGRSSVDPMRVM